MNENGLRWLKVEENVKNYAFLMKNRVWSRYIRVMGRLIMKFFPKPRVFPSMGRLPHDMDRYILCWKKMQN